MDELIPLSDRTLGSINSKVAKPSYDRSALTAGIIHIGLGNFHRAHQAWYLHRLFELGRDHDWAIIGAGVRPADALQRQKLKSQDWLTTLVELDPSGSSAEIIGSMTDFVEVVPRHQSLIERMAQPDIRIVSMTITEGGYFLDPASGKFNPTDPDIGHDTKNSENPKTVFGAIIAALGRRRNRGLGPLTIMSCDNLQGNGKLTRQVLLSLASMIDSDLSHWISTNCSFPNSMVDCIVPATGPKEIVRARSFGINDASPVTHEKFRQWIIEDDFCAGRPEWERVGAIFSDRVHDYETMKLRMLNGGHQIIAMPAELLGLNTIAQAMAEPTIHQFFRKVIAEEIAPNVKDVPEFTTKSYLDLIDRRFANPLIADTTRRVAYDGSSRQPGFLLPSIRDGLERGGRVDGLALSVAMWCRYCVGRREDDSFIKPNDPNWNVLSQIAIEAQNAPEKWLTMNHVFGDLQYNSAFSQRFTTWHQLVHSKGVEFAIEAYLATPKL